MAKAELSTVEKIYYYLMVIATFGVVWLCKIVIKKAIIESK